MVIVILSYIKKQVEQGMEHEEHGARYVGRANSFWGNKLGLEHGGVTTFFHENWKKC